MKTLKLKVLKADTKDYFGRLAEGKETDRIIVSEDTIITDENGKTVVLYKKIESDTSELLRAVQTIEYGTGQRTGGLQTRSAIFGFKPRNAIRGDYCSSTAMGKNFSWQHEVIKKFGKELAKEYRSHLEEKFIEHEELIKSKVKDEWVIEGTPFTSGIVNKNNQLGYHKDSGNFKGLYSNMIVLKKDVTGGMLDIPELNITIECQDNTIVYFDGQSLIHGVTPIKKTSKKGYRYTLVYYSLQQMWKCEGIDEEAVRINQIKAKRGLTV
jgi:hypothetical protein